MLRHVGLWNTAGLSDKAANYSKNKTPENRKILQAAIEKTCRKLLHKMGPEAATFVHKRDIFDRATGKVFNLLSHEDKDLGADGLHKGLVWTAAVASAGWMIFGNLSHQQAAGGKVLLALAVTSIASSFMGARNDLAELAQNVAYIVEDEAGAEVSKMQEIRTPVHSLKNSAKVAFGEQQLL